MATEATTTPLAYFPPGGRSSLRWGHVLGHLHPGGPDDAVLQPVARPHLGHHPLIVLGLGVISMSEASAVLGSNGCPTTWMRSIPSACALDKSPSRISFTPCPSGDWASCTAHGQAPVQLVDGL